MKNLVRHIVLAYSSAVGIRDDREALAVGHYGVDHLYGLPMTLRAERIQRRAEQLASLRFVWPLHF